MYTVGFQLLSARQKYDIAFIQLKTGSNILCYVFKIRQLMIADFTTQYLRLSLHDTFTLVQMNHVFLV